MYPYMCLGECSVFLHHWMSLSRVALSVMWPSTHSSCFQICMLCGNCCWVKLNWISVGMFASVRLKAVWSCYCMRHWVPGWKRFSPVGACVGNYQVSVCLSMLVNVQLSYCVPLITVTEPIQGFEMVNVQLIFASFSTSVVLGMAALHCKPS